jgi:hypothetical protein
LKFFEASLDMKLIMGLNYSLGMNPSLDEIYIK